ncbi:PH domain-containing protein [Metasolibacillus meyeri]|uniref:PH domain-containing protein n=1 Tax=Metasolibacillus meyeri TaxID=1071052 RepID=UPI000D319D65|nr:PH domain-containing protein [Metasolibacillus meyeri]
MPIHTIETVMNRFKEVGVSDLFGTKKEVKELPYILRESEEIMYATSGFVSTSTALIVCTTERVLFLDKGMFYGLKQTEIPLEAINSVSITKGLMLGKFTIHHGSAAALVEQVDKKTLHKMTDVINEQMKLAKNKGVTTLNTTTVENTPVVAEQPQQSAVQQLKELKELVDLGILTNEEFELKKKELLNL